MDKSRIEELANEIHMVAEESHYASAAYAVEQFLRIKRRDELYAMKIRLNEEIVEALKKRDSFFIKSLLDELNSISESEQLNEGRIIEFMYDDLLMDSARNITKGGLFRIILPEHLQKIIRDGLKNGDSEWTEEMVVAKNKLRRLALHELGHILIDEEQKSDSTEVDAEIFTNALLKLRVARNHSLKNSV